MTLTVLLIPLRSCLNFNKEYLLPGLPWWVQRLRLLTASAGGPGSISAQGTRSHELYLRILHAVTKTWDSQISTFLKKKNIHYLCNHKQYIFLIKAHTHQSIPGLSGSSRLV